MLCWEAVGHLEAHGGQVGHEEGVVGGVDGDAGHPSQGHCAQVCRNHHHWCWDEAWAILQTAGSCSETRECFAQLLASASWLSAPRKEPAIFLPPSLFHKHTFYKCYSNSMNLCRAGNEFRFHRLSQAIASQSLADLLPWGKFSEHSLILANETGHLLPCACTNHWSGTLQVTFDNRNMSTSFNHRVTFDYRMFFTFEQNQQESSPPSQYI